MAFEEQKARLSTAAHTAKNELDHRLDEAGSKVKQEASDIQTAVMRGASDMAETVSTKLKAAGVDTTVMVDAAKDKASELQRLIMEELKSRPMRALGIAAAIGAIFGMLSSR